MEEELKFQDQIDAQLATALSTESAIEWLKSNAIGKRQDGLFRSTSTRLKDIINISYASRDEPSVNLAVAKYGTHIETLKKLYQSDDPVIKMAILANPLIGPEAFMRGGVIEKSEAIKIIKNPEVNWHFIDALFSNPNIDREFLTEVVIKENEFKDIDDDTFLMIIVAINSNPLIPEKYDDTILDGWAEHSFGRLPDSLIGLLLSVPVNKSWAWLLCDLIPKIKKRYSGQIKPSVLNRWWDEEKGQGKNLTDQKKDKDAECYDDNYFYLRKEIAKILLTSHDELSPAHQDQAVRLAYYETTPPSKMFGYGIFEESFNYPGFKSSNKNNLNETQKKVVSVCENFFAQDKNKFIKSLIGNLSFWEREKERDLLNSLSWNLAEDKSSMMDVPNTYRMYEEDFRKKYPKFFMDDDFAEIPEEMALNHKIVKINERLEKIEKDLENLTSEEAKEEQKYKFKKLLDETNQELENLINSLKYEFIENSNERIQQLANQIQELVKKILILQTRQTSSVWMWIILLLLVFILFKSN
jgi:hypothetical protein